VTTHYTSCPLCEATCGLVVETDGPQVTSVRGDELDTFSKGYICPKGTALADLHHDPDRLRRPMRRDGETWHEMEWDEAFDLVATKLKAVQRTHGKHALAVYQGNPTVHNIGLVTIGQLALRSLGTRNMYSATSNDQLPHMLAALQMFGNQVLMPVPDLDRCDLLICMGANPLASNGSIMTAPDMRSRLKQIQARGGKVIVLDPRRTETAERADQHLYIRPGTDAVLLLAIAHEVFATSARFGRLAPHIRGESDLRRASLAWPPERAAPITGVAVEDIRALATALATTPRASLYGRIGVCTQEFGGLAAWLINAVNALTGHLDEPGGLMFTTPAFDPVPISELMGYDGGFARWHSRVSNKPEFGGELPMSAFAEEMLTPGKDQVRALITSAGNPVLSSPGGPQLEEALKNLDFMVSIDPYLNETTRLAHVILPGSSPLERSQFDAAFYSLAVRNIVKYSPAVFDRPADGRHDWEIMAALFARMALPSVGRGLAQRALGKLGPEAIVELGLRFGPWGIRKGRAGLSLAKLRAAPHGIDLGALSPRLPERLGHRDGKVQLAPKIYLDDLPRLEKRFTTQSTGLVMIGRRHLRSNNSWMHNSERLVKGPPRCTLLIHPDDAAARGLVEGGTANVATKRGAISLPIEISDSIMPGVVSVPHGWGHKRKNTQQRVASAHAGESVNDILDPALTDELSGTSALTGQPVEVS
jgi:anaerobic selenocysteine-containing dehydrogenase